MMKYIRLMTLLGFVSQSAHAGTWAWDGTEKAFWENHSVVYATFLKAELSSDGRFIRNANGYYSWTVQIHATLTGTFDAMRGSGTEQPLPVKGGGGCALNCMGNPMPNDRLLLVVTTSGNGALELGCDGILFFPSSCAFQPVKDLDDPIAVEVVNNLRKIRHTGPTEGLLFQRPH